METRALSCFVALTGCVTLAQSVRACVVGSTMSTLQRELVAAAEAEELRKQEWLRRTLEESNQPAGRRAPAPKPTTRPCFAAPFSRGARQRLRRSGRASAHEIAQSFDEASELLSTPTW